MCRWQVCIRLKNLTAQVPLNQFNEKLVVNRGREENEFISTRGLVDRVCVCRVVSMRDFNEEITHDGVHCVMPAGKKKIMRATAQIAGCVPLRESRRHSSKGIEA